MKYKYYSLFIFLICLSWIVIVTTLIILIRDAIIYK